MKSKETCFLSLVGARIFRMTLEGGFSQSRETLKRPELVENSPFEFESCSVNNAAGVCIDIQIYLVLSKWSVWDYQVNVKKKKWKKNQTTGVPPGFVLGPLLFVLFINNSFYNNSVSFLCRRNTDFLPWNKFTWTNGNFKRRNSYDENVCFIKISYFWVKNVF